MPARVVTLTAAPLVNTLCGGDDGGGDGDGSGGGGSGEGRGGDREGAAVAAAVEAAAGVAAARWVAGQATSTCSFKPTCIPGTQNTEATHHRLIVRCAASYSAHATSRDPAARLTSTHALLSRACADSIVWTPVRHDRAHLSN